MDLLATAVILSTVVALVARRQRRGHQAHAGRLLATDTVPVATVIDLHAAASAAAGGGVFREVVEVRGTVSPCTDPLSATLSGRACVWHRHRVRRREERKGDKGAVRSRTESEFTSTEPFLLDDGTGSLPVVPAVRPEGPVHVLSEFTEAAPGTRTLGYQRDEWLLEVGCTVFVHAVAEDSSGQLRLSAPDPTSAMVISTRSEAEERGRLDALTTGWRRVQATASVVALGSVVAILALAVR